MVGGTEECFVSCADLIETHHYPLAFSQPFPQVPSFPFPFPIYHFAVCAPTKYIFCLFICNPLPHSLSSLTSPCVHRAASFLPLPSSVSIDKPISYAWFMFSSYTLWIYLTLGLYDLFLPTLFLPSDPLLLQCLLLVIGYAYGSLTCPSPSCTPPSFINAYFESLVVDFWDFTFVCTDTPYTTIWIHFVWLLPLYVCIPSLVLPHFVHPTPFPSLPFSSFWMVWSILYDLTMVLFVCLSLFP